MRTSLAALALLACLLAPGTATASDSWSAPTDLYLQSAASENTSAYGTDSFEPTAARAGCRAFGKTAWWRIAGTGQSITLSTALAPTNFDTVLSVYSGAPPGPTFLACNDNLGGDVLNRSELTFASQRGTTYLVQVGGWNPCADDPALSPCPRFGALGLRATAAIRPANDDRANATPLSSGATAQADNTGATQEPGEDATCDGAPFAATVWFRWSAPAVGDASFKVSAAFGDSVVAVYRADSGARVGCSGARVDLRVSPGDYLVQVGARGPDGPATGQGNVLASVDFAEDRDGDDDGSSLPEDCNDADPAIRPGLKDTPGNAVDEDCAGGPAPYPRLAVNLTWFFRYPPLRFTALTLQPATAGMRVELRCRGRGCFKRAVVDVRTSRRSMSLLGRVRRARLKAGAVAEIRITQQGHVGFVRRITVRGGRRSPRIENLCLPVGASKPKRC